MPGHGRGGRARRVSGVPEIGRNPLTPVRGFENSMRRADMLPGLTGQARFHTVLVFIPLIRPDNSVLFFLSWLPFLQPASPVSLLCWGFLPLIRPDSNALFFLRTATPVSWTRQARFSTGLDFPSLTAYTALTATAYFAFPAFLSFDPPPLFPCVGIPSLTPP